MAPSSYSANIFSLVQYDELLKRSVVVVAARLTRAKGLEHPIDVFGGVAGKHRLWVIRVAFKISEVHHHNNLEALIIRMRLQNRVFSHGHLSF